MLSKMGGVFATLCINYFESLNFTCIKKPQRSVHFLFCNVLKRKYKPTAIVTACLSDVAAEFVKVYFTIE